MPTHVKNEVTETVAKRTLCTFKHETRGPQRVGPPKWPLTSGKSGLMYDRIFFVFNQMHHNNVHKTENLIFE